MRNISVRCPDCGAEFMVPASMAGRRARCTCGRPLTVPAAAQEPEGVRRSPPSLSSFRAAKWYVSEEGLSAGPFSFDEIKKMVLRGELTPERLVYAAPLGEWRRLSSVPWLQPGHGARKAGEEQWYVAVKGARYGPYSTERVLEMIKDGRLVSESLLWTQEMKGWRPLRRIKRFASALQQAEAGAGVEEMWYYIRDGDRVGPLSFEQIIAAAQEGKLSAGDRVWSNRLDGWRDAGSIPELARAAAQATGGRARLWYYRKRPRAGQRATAEGDVRGPVSLRKLCGLVETKQLTAGDTVYHKGLGAWRDIRDVPELQAALAAAVSGLGRTDRAAEQWYFRTGQAGGATAAKPERGPVTERFLAEMVAKGSVKADDLVWGPHFDRWRPVREVPSLVRHLPAEALDGRDLPDLGPAQAAREGEPTEIDTAEVETLTQPARPTLADHRRTVIALVAVGALTLILAATLYLDWRSGAGTIPGEAAGEPPFGVPEEPVAFVKAWLGLFLTDAEELAPLERQIHRDRLDLFCRGGQIDAYAEDARSALKEAGAGVLSVREVPCGILRAEDGQSFCYHVPFAGPSVTVRAVLPARSASGDPQQVQKTFARDRFGPLRCFRVTAGDSASAPSALVLVEPPPAESAAGDLRVVALGRLAYVGAAAGAMRIRYATGYKSASMTESDSLLCLGVSREPGLEATDWRAYGELMSVDTCLVPARALKRSRQLSVRSGERLLVTTRTGLARNGVASRYGPPQSTETIELPAAGVRAVAAVPGVAVPVYPRVVVDHYGPFGVASEPASGEVIGFLFAVR